MVRYDLAWYCSEDYGDAWLEEGVTGDLVKYEDVKGAMKEILIILNNARGYCLDELGDDFDNVLDKYKEFLE